MEGMLVTAREERRVGSECQEPPADAGTKCTGMPMGGLKRCPQPGRITDSSAFLPRKS